MKISSFKKTMGALTVAVLSSTLFSAKAFAICFPEAPLAYGSYYPIQIKNKNGQIWKGKLLPTTTRVVIRDSGGKFIGRFPIEQLTSSSSCTGASFARFKIPRIIGSNGNTWVTINRYAGIEKYNIAVFWNGVTYNTNN